MMYANMFAVRFSRSLTDETKTKNKVDVRSEYAYFYHTLVST